MLKEMGEWEGRAMIHLAFLHFSISLKVPISSLFYISMPDRWFWFWMFCFPLKEKKKKINMQKCKWDVYSCNCYYSTVGGGRGGESKKSKVFAMGQFWPMSLSTLVFLKKTLFYSSQSWAAVYLVIINQALLSLRFFKQSFSGMINLRPTFHFKREGRANGLAFQSCLPPQISRYPCHSHLLEVTAEAD